MSAPRISPRRISRSASPEKTKDAPTTPLTHSSAAVCDSGTIYVLHPWSKIVLVDVDVDVDVAVAVVATIIVAMNVISKVRRLWKIIAIEAVFRGAANGRGSADTRSRAPRIKPSTIILVDTLHIVLFPPPLRRSRGNICARGPTQIVIVVSVTDNSHPDPSNYRVAVGSERRRKGSLRIRR